MYLHPLQKQWIEVPLYIDIFAVLIVYQLKVYIILITVHKNSFQVWNQPAIKASVGWFQTSGIYYSSPPEFWKYENYTNYKKVREKIKWRKNKKKKRKESKGKLKER